MMKKQWVKTIIAGSLFFFFAAGVHAQADSAKAAKLQSELADTVCKCISHTDTSTIKGADDIQGLFMKCFMGSGMGLFMDYSQASGVEMTDITGMQTLVTKMGADLYATCPAMLKIMTKMASDTAGYEKLMEQYKEMSQPSNKAVPMQKN
jgi:hypothetical protein